MTAYLLHFARPVGNLANPRAQARHYLGFTPREVGDGVAEHLHGTGSPLMKVAVSLSIEVGMADTWSGDRKLERKLKNRKGRRALCLFCRREGR